MEERLDPRQHRAPDHECSRWSRVELDDSAQDRAETLGRPLPQTEIMVADAATGEPVPSARRPS